MNAAIQLSSGPVAVDSALQIQSRPQADSAPAPIAVDIYTAATMLGVCHVTIRREIERGELRAVKIGRVWRIRVAELHAYLKRKEGLTSR